MQAMISLLACCALLVHQSVDAMVVTSSVTNVNMGTNGAIPSVNSDVSPLSLSIAELAEKLEGSGKAKSFWSNVRDGIDPFSGESTLTEKTKSKLLDSFINPLLRDAPVVPTTLPTCITHETVSSCGGRKQLHRMRDGLEVESVIIPHNSLPRVTLCVSSQVGCDRGCVFCATGKMGLVKNLTPDEILSQVYWAKMSIRKHNLQPLKNIVFMGMGDIGKNLASVRAAAQVLTDQNRFGIAPSKVTLSTVGPTPDTFHELAQIPGTLAWSLHSAIPELRRRLVPSSKYHDPIELRDALIDALMTYKSSRQRSIMIAVTLIKGINCGVSDAEALVEFLEPFRQKGIKVNVDMIPCNDIGLDDFKRPSNEDIVAYKEILHREKYSHSVRLTRGEEDASACGMLATSRKPKTELDMQISDIREELPSTEDEYNSDM